MDEEDGQIDSRTGILNNRNSEFYCQGILTLIHTHPALGLNSMRSSRLRGNNFYDIGTRLLKDRVTLHTRADGNCCWKMYERRNFRGRFEVISGGHDEVFQSFQPQSIQKAPCTTLI